jgi:hypothetical protein
MGDLAFVVVGSTSEYAESTGTTITSTSADALFPLTNLVVRRPGRPFIFAAAAADDLITLDLGSALSVDFASLHGHNIDSGVTAIRLRSKATAFGVGPSDGTLQATFTKRDPAFYARLGSPVSHQFWRFVFEGTNGNPIEVGEISLGLAGTPTTRMPRHERDMTERRRQIRNRTRGGQLTVVNLTKFSEKEWDFTFRGSFDDVEDLRDNLWAQSQHGGDPVVIVPDLARPEVSYGTLAEEFSVPRLYANTNSSQELYDYSLTLEESAFGVTITEGSTCT